MTDSANILLIDGDPLTLTGLAAALHLSGYHVICAADEEAAEKAAGRQAFDLIIFDGARMRIANSSDGHSCPSSPRFAAVSSQDSSDRNVGRTNPSYEYGHQSLPTWDWLVQLRANPLQQESPCVCLVTEAETELRANIDAAWWATAVIKPYNPKSLLAVIENTLWMPHLMSARCGVVKNHAVGSPEQSNAIA